MVSDTDAMYLMADDELDPLDHELLKEEQVRAIRLAAEKLPPRCQRLLGLLMGDEDLPYTEIAEQLSMPVGSIGPTRGRCLEHLRQLLEEVELSRHRGGPLAVRGIPRGRAFTAPHQRLDVSRRRSQCSS